MSQNKKFDFIIMIGDFSPLHIKYEQQLDEALTLSDNVIILINNTNIPRNIEHPFSFSERRDLIVSVLDNNVDTVYIEPIINYMYNWKLFESQILSKVYNIILSKNSNQSTKIGIYTTDNQLAYKFPQFEHIRPTIRTNNTEDQEVRNLMFSHGNVDNVSHFFSQSIFDKLVKFTQTNEFKDLQHEWQYVNNYKKSWEGAPFPPTFVTADAVVTHSGHILMVIRGGYPGHNLYALPGGFLEQDETLEECAIRELKEETRINIPTNVLLSSIKSSKVFDNPNRSSRGRTITQAFFIELQTDSLPIVKGSDDATLAVWVPFNQIDLNTTFEDHYHIKSHFIP